MKKETLTKISAIVLSAALLSACNQNKPNQTTSSIDVTTEPTTATTKVSQDVTEPTISESVTTEPITEPTETSEITIPTETTEPAETTLDPKDFNFPNPVDMDELKELYVKYRTEGIKFALVYDKEMNAVVVHTYNTIFTGKDKEEAEATTETAAETTTEVTSETTAEDPNAKFDHYVLGCGLDNVADDKYAHTYVNFDDSIYDYCEIPAELAKKSRMYFCDDCVDTNLKVFLFGYASRINNSPMKEKFSGDTLEVKFASDLDKLRDAKHEYEATSESISPVEEPMDEPEK